MPLERRPVHPSDACVAWALANPAFQVAIVGTRNLAHVDDSIEVADLVLAGA
jgi:aryl-alcohol dehydrogenase-like predicted oxidoreductase